MVVEDKKRFLFLLHGATLGGAQLSVLEVLSHMPASCDALVIVPEEGPLVDELEALGIESRCVSLPRFYHTVVYQSNYSLRRMPKILLSMASQLWQLRAVLKEYRPDLVIVNSTVLAAVLIGVRSFGYRVAVHVREVIPEAKHSRISRIVLRAITFSAQRVFVESKYSKTNVSDYVPHSMLRVLPNWANAHCFECGVGNSSLVERKRVRAELGVDDREFLVLMFGQLIPEKGVFDLLQAAFILHAEEVPCRFVFVGDTLLQRSIGQEGALDANSIEPSVDESLLQAVKTLRLNDIVHFVGVKKNVLSYLAAADAVVATPRCPESFGRTVVEAMAAAKPIVVSDCGPMTELLEHEKEGLVVPVQSPRAIAAALRRLRAQPEFATTLAQAARVKAGRCYSDETNIAALWAEYCVIATSG